MIRDRLSKRERVTGLIAFALCIAIILVFVGISFVNQASVKNNLESFSCRFSSGSTFLIDVEVELSDGMDQGEAINVATCALNRIQVVDSKEQIGTIETSADVDRDGVWTVKLKCMHIIDGNWMRSAEHVPVGTMTTLRSYEVIIDPINRTVEDSMLVIEQY